MVNLVMYLDFVTLLLAVFATGLALASSSPFAQAEGWWAACSEHVTMMHVNAQTPAMLLECFDAATREGEPGLVLYPKAFDGAHELWVEHVPVLMTDVKNEKDVRDFLAEIFTQMIVDAYIQLLTHPNLDKTKVRRLVESKQGNIRKGVHKWFKGEGGTVYLFKFTVAADGMERRPTTEQVTGVPKNPEQRAHGLGVGPDGEQPLSKKMLTVLQGALGDFAQKSRSEEASSGSGQGWLPPGDRPLSREDKEDGWEEEEAETVSNAKRKAQKILASLKKSGGPWQCPKCKDDFTAMLSLARHLPMCLSGRIKEYKCGFCEKTCRSATPLISPRLRCSCRPLGTGEKSQHRWLHLEHANWQLVEP